MSLIINQQLDSIQTTSETLTLSISGGLSLPTGGTAQRPAGAAGMIRYNSDGTGGLEVYNGSIWTNFNSGVVGPVSSTANAIAVWADASGTNLANSGILVTGGTNLFNVGTIAAALATITNGIINSGTFANLAVLSNSSLNVQVQSGGSGNAAWLSLNAVGGTAYTGINFIDKNINKFSTFIDTTAGGTNLSFRMALDEINNKDFIVAIPNGNLVLGPSQNLTIDQNGNVGIVGTGNAAQLYIYSAGAGNGAGIVIDNSNGGNTFAQTTLQVNGTTKYTYGQASNSFFIADYVSTTPVDFVYYQNGSLKLGSAQNFVISSSGALSVTSPGIAATINGGLTVNSPGNSVVLNGGVANNSIGYVLNNTAGREWVLGAVGSAASSFANGFWIYDATQGAALAIDSTGQIYQPLTQPATNDRSNKIPTTNWVGNNFPPLPTNSGGLGQIVYINNTIPAGGSWAYFVVSTNGGGNITGGASGVAAGGSHVGSGVGVGFAWRIA